MCDLFHHKEGGGGSISPTTKGGCFTHYKGGCFTHYKRGGGGLFCPPQRVFTYKGCCFTYPKGGLSHPQEIYFTYYKQNFSSSKRICLIHTKGVTANLIHYKAGEGGGGICLTHVHYFPKHSSKMTKKIFWSACSYKVSQKHQ